MEEEKVLEENPAGEISEMAQTLAFGAIAIASFFVPFAFGHPQWLVGVVVNAMMFLSAIKLPKKYFIALAVLPSLGVLARGIVFGPLTSFLVYFLPFIWLGNLVLIFLFKTIVAGGETRKWFLAVFVASFAKFALLFLTANLYFNFGFVPKLFLMTMGLDQLATALAGGVLAFFIHKTLKWNQKTKI